MTTDSQLFDVFESAVFRELASISGYVYDPLDHERQFVVELLLDGWPYKIARADAFDNRCPTSGLSDACHGFAFVLPDGCEAAEVEVRLANFGVPLAESIDMTAPREASPDPLAPGRVDWTGGLRFEGWVTATDAPESFIRGIIEGAVVFDVRPNGWTFVHHGDRPVPLPSFAVHLPVGYADGRVRELYVVDADGRQLAGSPLTFVAFVDGLESFLSRHVPDQSEQLRGRQFDALLPRSLPLHMIEDWRTRFPFPAPSGERPTVAVILFGENGVEKSLASLESSKAGWLLGVVPLQSDSLVFDPYDLIAFLEGDASTTETVIFALSGAVFAPGSLWHLSDALKSGPAPLAYADVVLERRDGTRAPLAFGAFDLERFLEQGYAAHLFAIDRATVLQTARRGASNPFELFLMAVEREPTDVPYHIPSFLATCPLPSVSAAGSALEEASRKFLSDRGTRAAVTKNDGVLLPSVHVRRTVAADSVAILVPVRNRRADLSATVESIRGLSTRHRVELRIVDMESSDEGTLRYLADLHGQHEHVSRLVGTWNPARAINAAAAEARSRLLWILESGSVVASSEHLDELVSRCAPLEIAAAGPLLMSAGLVRAAGLVVGPRFGVAPVCVGCSIDEPGPSDLLRATRSVSALPLPGLMVKRGDFLAVEGLEAGSFGHVFHSVDLSLKLLAKGKRLVLTPHARMELPERSMSLERLTVADGHPRAQSELTALRRRWGHLLLADPTYGAALGHDVPYESLAWPPRWGSLHASKSPDPIDPPVEQPISPEIDPLVTPRRSVLKRNGSKVRVKKQ